MMLTNLSRETLIRNLEATAARVAGRAVTVRIIDHPRVYGLVQKNVDGRAVMDLHPDIFESIERFIDTFTHETAHIVRHFDSMPRRDVNKGVAREVTKQAIHLASRGGQASQVQQHESEADELAAKWQRVINTHYGGYVAITGDPIYSVLQILYHRVTKEN